MHPFEKILVPVDFSEYSTEALQYALDLARRYSAHIELIHVYQPVGYTLPEGYVLYTPHQLTDLLAELDKCLARVRREAENAGASSVGTQMLMGTPFQEILRVAEEGGHDLIVMGTHGRTGLTHALLGSVTEKVVRKAPCPVLTVHAKAKSGAG